MQNGIRRSRGAVIRLSGGTLILILILIGAAIFFTTPSFTTPGGTQVTIAAPPVPGITTVEDAEFIAYDLGMTFQESLATTGGAITTATPSYNVVHSNNRRLANIDSLHGESIVNIASGSTKTAFTVQKSDGDYLFINVDPGTTDYPVPSRILNDNSYLTMCKWIPVTNANVPELVCELQLSRLGGLNFNIDFPRSAQLLVAAIPHDLALTMSAPADQDSLGTVGSTDVFVDWDLTALAADEAFDFARIWISSNQTTAFMEVLDITITSGPDIIEMATFTNLGNTFTTPSAYATAGTAAGVTQFWRYYPVDEDISNDYTNTLLIARGSQDADSIRVRIHAQVSFAAGTDAVDIILHVRLVSAANGVQAEVTDTVSLGG